MTVVFGVLLVLLVGAVAVVAAGRGDPMVEEYDDRPDVRVPDGPLTAEDLRSIRFSTVVRGYRASEVDALIARLARQLDGVDTTPDPTDPPDAAAGPAPDPDHPEPSGDGWAPR